ncbi:site-specific DNA-methyltransferase [Ornithobacterium rhinotracheale]|nr:site-specific DNA-methyltransferase [Ornithobacterium rhinotracheale]
MDKLDLQSPDLVNENFEKLAKLFPNCVTEGTDGKAIDFDLLKQELSHAVVEGNKERYRLEWPGKREAIVTANLPTTNTLRPVREDSVDFDNTENLYIEGDNLEVLKLLQESYLGKVKMIYIDPPYNTGTNMIYTNDFSEDANDYLEASGQTENQYKLINNPNTDGRFHSKWLSMMYPRIKLARNLLTEDGFVVIAMDDSEIENTIKLCDEIFGETNRVGIVTVVHKPEGRNQEKFFGTSNEYALFYAKNKNIASFNNVAISDKVKETFTERDEKGLYRLNSFINKNHGSRGKDTSSRENRPKFWYPIFVNPVDLSISIKHRDGDVEVYPVTSTQERTWRTLPESLVERLKLGNIIAKKESDKIMIYEKYYENQVIKTHWVDSKYHATINGTKIISDLFGKPYFDFPKSLYLIIDILKLTINKKDIVLDFFSGSSTTAHAIMELNAKENKNLKYIMVQLPETTSEDSEAYKAGYKNICEIGKERIRRAAKKIKEETGADIDYGFRVYRLDSSNMQDVYYKPQDYTQESLSLFQDNIKPDRTADDLLAQVMLDWGLPLSLPIEQEEIDGKQVFKVASDSLYACFDEGIGEDFAKAIAKEAPLRVVFKDSSFESDTAKINVQQLLKQLSPETEMKVI